MTLIGRYLFTTTEKRKSYYENKEIHDLSVTKVKLFSPSSNHLLRKHHFFCYKADSCLDLEKI